MYPLSDSTAIQDSQSCAHVLSKSSPVILTKSVLLLMLLRSRADGRTLQTEIGRLARCACPIAMLVYVSTDIAVVVK